MSKKTLTGAQILWECLVREGVEVVFGYPGGAILPAYDAMLERFPHLYHEPYYHGYIRENFTAIARSYGLAHRPTIKAYLSKVMVFDKDAG